MSFCNTKTPVKPAGPVKWQVPKRRRAETGYPSYCLEGELKEKFRELFPKNSNRRLMKWFGLSFSTLQRFKRELGLKKDMKAIRKQQARDAKRKCEANGYYASLRGRRPSQAVIEGARRKRAEGFCPLKALKAKNPRKYREMLRRRGEARRELFRKERLREEYGLPRKTRLRMKTMTRRMSSRKHRMLKVYNYFPDEERVDTVWWDGRTRRSPRMEAAAAEAGLRVLRADEAEEEEKETDTKQQKDKEEGKA